MQMTAANRVHAETDLHQADSYKHLFLIKFLSVIALVLLGVLLHLPAHAQAPVARVLETKGTTLVERSGQMPRLLGAGETLSERDTINVARDSWAIIEFNDQTRVSLRPNTVFRLDSYKADAPETMLLGLVKGGLRVVTGLFGKRNPQGVKVQTAVATIGIRGTEFDARLCADDCAAEEKAAPAPRPVVLPVARVVEMNGVVAAGRAGETVRLLVPGAMLNEGDAVATGRNGNAVLVFRDGARVTLAANSRFAINRFRYDEASPTSGSAFLTLYAGNALVTTGQLAKISPDAFVLRTALGVVRPFGTTFGAGGCFGSLCASGSVTVSSDGASASGSASGGGASASGTASAGAGGASASGTASAGGNTASGSTGTLALPPTGTAGAPNAQQVMNEVINGVNQVVAQVASTATTQGHNAQQQVNNVGVAVQNQVQNTGQAVSDALVTQAVNALNAAATPIVSEMTALMIQIRNNPPSTEAAWRDVAARSSQLSQQMSAVMSTALAGAGSVADVSAFKIAMGMLQLMNLEFNGTLGQAGYAAFAPVGVAFSQIFFAQLRDVRNSPYLASSFEAIGISNADMDRALFIQVPDSAIVGVASALSPGHLMRAKEILEVESFEWMKATGSAAADALFAEARAASDAARQRSEQEAATARASADVAKAAADVKIAAAGKAAEEKLAAEKGLAEQKVKIAVAEATRSPDNPGNLQAGERTYDLGGSAVGTVPPGVVLQPGILKTRAGEPTVTRDGDVVRSEWIEQIVPGEPVTDNKSTPLGGTVRRTVTAYPDGSTVTTLEFSGITFGSPPIGVVGPGGITLGTPGPLLSVRGAGLVFTSVSSPDSQAAQANANGSASVGVWDGEVEVVGRGRVRKGEMLASTGSPVRMANIPGSPAVKVDPDLFRETTKPVEQGLYVWVRDGAVQVAKEDQSVDVSAGNAAVATRDRVRLLDVVPNFLRFDSTPRPFPALGDTKVDAFRAADGALLNMCTVR